MTAQRAAAFFDLDRTLMAGSSGRRSAPPPGGGGRMCGRSVRAYTWTITASPWPPPEQIAAQP